MTNAHSCQDFMDRLDALGLFHMDLTLDRMAAFAARALAGKPRPRFPILHVVGTNGKGSTATLLASLLTAHGLRVGLSVSPHFVSPRERILVDGRQLSEEQWGRLGAKVFEMSADIGLTYFEVLTALSLLAFEEERVDVAVIEAGLGGRYDATNVLSPALTVYTPMGLDHTAVLGPTLTHIAADKAGAMRTGGVAVSAPQDDEAWQVLAKSAGDIGCTLLRASDVLSYNRNTGALKPGQLTGKSAGTGGLAHLSVRPMQGLRLGLAGKHQEQNARTALAALHVFAARLRLPVSEDACRQGLAKAFIPGRMQLVDNAAGLPARLILDGGHNAHGLAALAESMRSMNLWPAAVVFACLRDKPLADMLPIVREIAGLERGGRLLACGITGNERALSGPELAQLLGEGAEAHADVRQALQAVAEVSGPVLVCGSLYLLGEFYTQHLQLLEPPA